MAENERFLLKVPVARLLSEGKSDEVGRGKPADRLRRHGDPAPLVAENET